MENTGNESLTVGRQVRLLTEAVARKIAAGEVIDRPYAAVRELLDNAIDAGSREITLSLNGGGIDEIRVTDDGVGMTREDMEVCWLPHATSKIETFDDLEKISTLGFRGEALSSMAACSRLEIVSRRGEEAFRLSVHGGKQLELSSHGAAPGTTVSVKDLFFNMPARRRFLKSSRAESTLCRRIFTEKAAAHPELNFRLFVDGILKLFLPAGSAAERVSAAWPRLAPPSGWWETTASGDGFSITVVHGRPEVSRKDRQYIQIYANRRRIDEFGLVQAVQYAYDAYMPGGAFPVAFVFVRIDPSLVDFNIHPAKKEARFRDLPSVRHRLIEAIKDRLTTESYRQRATNNAAQLIQSELISPEQQRSADYSENGISNHTNHGSTTSSVSNPSASFNPGLRKHRPDQDETDAFIEAAAKLRRQERHIPAKVASGTPFRYLGQVMGVFLVAESSGSLFIVDQHAAHERILFEKYLHADPVSERLLIPRSLELDRSALMKLELRRERLSSLGIEIEKEDSGKWQLTALPKAASGMEGAIVEFIEAGAGEAEALEKNLWADLSCKAAVKDNSPLDDDAAQRLLEEAFALETPRCPHGRPIWFEVSRRDLFELVGRTV